MTNILFTHIEKCGGTWIRNIFREADWTVYVDDREWHKGSSPHTLTVNQNFCINNHGDWDHHLIVLRDPWVRLLSYYNYSIASAWLESGEATTHMPPFRMFIENLALDLNYGDKNRHEKLPKYFPENTMPYRSMRYTLDLLNSPALDISEQECVFDLGSPELYHWLDETLNIESEMYKPLNSSRELLERNGWMEHYKESINAVEKAGVLALGVLDDDISMWDSVTENKPWRSLSQFRED